MKWELIPLLAVLLIYLAFHNSVKMDSTMNINALATIYFYHIKPKIWLHLAVKSEIGADTSTYLPHVCSTSLLSRMISY